MVDNSDYLEDLFNSTTMNATLYDSTYSINAMIINNSTVNLTITDRAIPVFSLDADMYNNISIYNIDKESDNTYAILYYLKYDETSNILLALILSIVITVALLVTLIIWQMCMKKFLEHVGNIQKIFTVFMYLKLLLCIVVVYYIKLCMEDTSIDNMGDTIIRIYVQTVVTTIQSVLKTILWFIVVIVSFVFKYNARVIKYIGEHSPEKS
jgi:hypothetical protein